MIKKQTYDLNKNKDGGIRFYKTFYPDVWSQMVSTSTMIKKEDEKGIPVELKIFRTRK